MNRCNLQDTCKHGDVCASPVANLTLIPLCYDKVEEGGELFAGRRDEEKKNQLF